MAAPYCKMSIFGESLAFCPTERKKSETISLYRLVEKKDRAGAAFFFHKKRDFAFGGSSFPGKVQRVAELIVVVTVTPCPGKAMRLCEDVALSPGKSDTPSPPPCGPVEIVYGNFKNLVSDRKL